MIWGGTGKKRLNQLDASRFVFFDFNGQRWNRVRLATLLGVALASILLVIFIRAVLVLPKLEKPEELSHPGSGFRVATQPQESIPPSPLPPDWLRQKPGSSAPPLIPRNPLAYGEPVFLAFHAPWDPASFESLQSQYRNITHVAPEWFSMKSFKEPLIVSRDDALAKFSASAGVKLLPLLTNLHDNEWQPEIVEELARRPERRRSFFDRLKAELRAVDAAGVLVDWQQVDPVYRDGLTALLTDLARALHEERRELWLSIPVGNDIAAFDLDALASVVDRFVALLYDENGENDSPGPIASLPWWNEWLEVLLEHGDRRQWVVGIGNYGYDWPAGGVAATLSFKDAMARARLAGARGIGVEAPLYQPHFTYEESGVPHSLWFLDAITFRNQYATALREKVGGVALYRLGQEDAAIWTVVAKPGASPKSLERIDPANAVANIGEGDLLTVANERAMGRRAIAAPTAAPWEARYEKLPAYPLIHHRGRAAGDDRVVLSFDDGPDPVWTPRILDILKAEGVKAVFFVVGSRAAENPELVRRILAEGHELGNHSYSHPDLARATEQRTVFELNANQRILEGITGISTLLFRPPYHSDAYPQSYAEFLTLVKAQELGYLSIAESIDSEDWNEPTPETVFGRVKERRAEGNIILLHDGGGDRSATVAALPRIIAYLRERGDQIVLLETLFKLPREALMPPIPTDDPARSRAVAQTGLNLLQKAEAFAWTFVIGATLLLFARTTLVALLALRHRRSGERWHGNPAAGEPVSVIIAAYNEAKVIASTIRSILISDYPGPLELIIVDDGSTDDTLAMIGDLAARDSRVRVFTQHNMGKAHALDRALQAASHEIVVMLDADTQFLRDTLRHLVAPLAAPEVGAVSGHIRVGNPTSWIARFQALEYICGFNLDRRAYDCWDAITVVPGAASAFKKSAIVKAGGIVADTLAEDTDLTFQLHRVGYRIRYAPQAVAYTEAPDTLRALVRQRIRWAFGTLQCLWKHRDLTGSFKHPGLGWFSLPSMWFCHVFLVALIPVVDVMLVLSLIWGAGGALVGYAVFFFALEWVLALLGCHLEREPLRTSLRIFPMRLVYRPLLCYAVWASLIRALRGAWYGWGKQERKGSVIPVFESIQETRKKAA